MPETKPPGRGGPGGGSVGGGAGDYQSPFATSPLCGVPSACHVAICTLEEIERTEPSHMLMSAEPELDCTE